MARVVRFRCRNCGNRFESEILDENDKREVRRKNLRTSPVRCPSCNRTDVREGWD